MKRGRGRPRKGEQGKKEESKEAAGLRKYLEEGKIAKGKELKRTPVKPTIGEAGKEESLESESGGEESGEEGDEQKRELVGGSGGEIAAGNEAAAEKKRTEVSEECVRMGEYEENCGMNEMKE